MKAPAWWQRYRAWRLRHVTRLFVSDDAFTVVRRADALVVPWDAVLRVEAYKRDLLTVDLLCLMLTTRDSRVEIDEDMSGYSEVEAKLCKRLGISGDWKSVVLFPAFVANSTVLFDANTPA